MVSTYLRNAREMCRRAIESREKIYEGEREAKERASRKGSSAIIEVQTWMSHEQCKALVADNQWNMQQSLMYSALSQAEALEVIKAQNAEIISLLKHR